MILAYFVSLFVNSLGFWLTYRWDAVVGKAWGTEWTNFLFVKLVAWQEPDKHGGTSVGHGFRGSYPTY